VTSLPQNCPQSCFACAFGSVQGFWFLHSVPRQIPPFQMAPPWQGFTAFPLSGGPIIRFSVITGRQISTGAPSSLLLTFFPEELGHALPFGSLWPRQEMTSQQTFFVQAFLLSRPTLCTLLTFFLESFSFRLPLSCETFCALSFYSKQEHGQSSGKETFPQFFWVLFVSFGFLFLSPLHLIRKSPSFRFITRH